MTESSKPKPRFFLKMEVYVLTGFEIPCSPSDLSYTFINIVANVASIAQLLMIVQYQNLRAVAFSPVIFSYKDGFNS